MRSIDGRCWALALAVLLLVPLAGAAQEGEGGVLTGVVEDAQGAVIPGAAVVAAEQETKAEFRTLADGTGKWTIASVPAGVYTVTVTAPSTVPAVVEGIRVDPGTTMTADVTLKVGIRETVVVTASRVEELLVNAPAAVSIISGRTARAAPTQDYADLLRAVPGVNVVQMSARDFTVTPRAAAAGAPAGTQLVMIDGRSINQDYFGYVAWDFLPNTLSEVKRIEVLRGAASAVWGANAMNGVVNILTYSPQEMAGSTITLGAGTFDRSDGVAESDRGTLYYLSGSHARVINDRWSAKGSAGYYETDPLARPAGTIPNAFNTPYPDYENFGTKQPKVDLRLDYDAPDGTQHVSVSGGYAATGGPFHTGFGPFRLEDGASSTYAKVDYRRGSLSVRSFLNLWHGVAASLLSVGPLGDPIVNEFDDKTFDIAMDKSTVLGGRHVLTFGGNYRHNWADLTMAPGAEKRDEGGIFAEGQIVFHDRLRWIVGGRVDKFDVLDKLVVSPRTTLLLKPTPNQTIRASYGRGYRAPALFHNYLVTSVVNRIDLGLINPAVAGMQYFFPLSAAGNLDLEEQTLDGFEVGYAASLAEGRVHAGATFYLTNNRNNFVLSQSASYTSQNLPPGWPLPPFVLDALVAANAFGPGMGLPSLISYGNLGEIRNKGFEANMDAQLNSNVSVFANYSWQADPESPDDSVRVDIPGSQVNHPPSHRFNAGVSFDYGRILGDLSVGYVGPAYFQDVLDVTYAGWTEPFTVINAGLGVRLAGDNAVLAVKARNLSNEPVQNHLFGDLLKRQIVAELRLRMGR